MPGQEPAADEALQLAHQLADMARHLLTPAAIDATVDRIVRLAAEAIDGCDEAGLCAASGETGAQTPPTSPLLNDLDRAQSEYGEGPCVDALSRGSAYVADMQDSSPWPRFAPRATAAGFRTVLAVRLFRDSETLGTLQMYGREPDAISTVARAQALIMASYAGIALGLAEQAQSERDRHERLLQALVYRDVIGQAQGILMERERITGDAAFSLLREASQDLNIKLRDVAQGLVDTGLIHLRTVPEEPPAPG